LHKCNFDLKSVIPEIAQLCCVFLCSKGQATGSEPKIVSRERELGENGRVGRLVGKVAIVTGGASGIGEATARLFASHGARVVIADISAERSLAVATAIKNVGGRALARQTDITDESSVVALMDQTEATFGRLDVLVNSAGISLSKLDVDTSVEEWDHVMAINVKGTFLTTKHAVPLMKKVRGGSIINIASIAANVGWAGFAAYCASKGAVRALTKASAIAHGRDGVRVNSVHPGVTRTPMTEASLNQKVGRYGDGPPLGRFGEAIDIANCCLFLASDESAFVHGAELIADGGTIAI
jgi:NAD(P)-dependent dehydrogenase (short-subunit alcohol dehydrogenase family)